MESDHVVVLGHGTRPDTAELLHVGTNTQKQTQVDTESTDIGTGLTAHPEDTEVAVVVELVQLALVDGTDTELTLDGGDERGTLEEGTGEGLESAGELGLAAGDLVVQADDADILLSGALLGLDQAGGTVDADDETASDLGVEGAAVAGLLDAQDTLDPGDDLVRRGVRGLVEVDDTAGNVALEVALVRSTAVGDGDEVVAAGQHLAVVLQQQRPLAGVDGRGDRGRLDGVVRIVRRD